MTATVSADEAACERVEALGFPLPPLVQGARFQLTLHRGALALRDHEAPERTPLVIDFAAGALTYRRERGSLRREALAKAVGLTGTKRPDIIDCTAGLGRDSFMLASFGARVAMVEQSPALGLLLADALHRAEADPDLAEIAARMTLRVEDATRLLEQAESLPVVYIDPMFPVRRKSAKVKAGMAFLQRMIGPTPPGLLEAAFASSASRIVVKRAPAVPVHGQPTFTLPGKTSSFDVYVR